MTRNRTDRNHDSESDFDPDKPHFIADLHLTSGEVLELEWMSNKTDFAEVSELFREIHDFYPNALNVDLDVTKDVSES